MSGERKRCPKKEQVLGTRFWGGLETSSKRERERERERQRAFLQCKNFFEQFEKTYWAVQKLSWVVQKILGCAKNILGCAKIYWAVQNMNMGTQTIDKRAARGDWNQLLNYLILECESRMSIGQYKSTFWLIHHVLEFWTDPANQLTWWSGLPRSLELDRGFAVPQVPSGVRPLILDNNQFGFNGHKHHFGLKWNSCIVVGAKILNFTMPR